MSYRALIADDEPLLAEAMKAALHDVWPELAEVHVVGDGARALDYLVASSPDVAFLDIRMPGLTGLEVALELLDRLPPEARTPLLVFVTAYDEFALEAFEYAPVDYLLKPVSLERLAKTVGRLKARLASPASGLETLARSLQPLLRPPATAAPPLRHLRASLGNSVRLIAVDEILYLRATDKYVSVVTREGEAVVRLALKELVASLPPERFQQIHRSVVVNLDAVAAATRSDDGKVHLKLRGRNETLPVSRVFNDLFKPM
jgi:DNA-binding LytR/AlgR family response regulator